MTPNMAANSESSVASLYNNEAVATTYIQNRFSSAWGKILHASQVRQINDAIRDYQPHTILEIAPGPARIAVDLKGVRHGLMIEYSVEMLKFAKYHLSSSAGLDSLWEIHQHNAFDLESLHLQCHLLYSFPVTVHVVEARNSCQVMLMSRTIAAYECRTPLTIRALVANPGYRPGLHPCTLITRDGVRGGCPAFGSDGAAPERAVAARLAHVLPASVERPVSGDRETAPWRTEWTAARRAVRPRGVGTGAVAG
jgi:hypothetical protein